LNIKTIAKLARVSTSAVSIALNGKPGVSEKTRNNILRIAREVEYRHRALPDPLAVKTVQFVACVDGDIIGDDMSRSPFFVDLVRNIEREARHLGYACMISTVPISAAAKQIERMRAPFANAGLILLGTNIENPQLEALAAIAKHVVVVDTLAVGTHLNTVAINNRQGAMLAAQHLLDLGHHSIGYGCGGKRISNFEEREIGFRDALAAVGISFAESNRFPLPSDIKGAATTFSEQLSDRKGNMPTAIFCDNDYMAIGLIKALSAAGYRVPKDCSIIGFDNINEGRVISPELTTIHVPVDQISKRAVERLVELLNGSDGPPIKQIVDTSLVIRDSTSASCVDVC